MATPTEPRRLRWSVPAVDESTNRWLDKQHDISLSLRLLIRESIQRDGYIDVVNRPVEQLPRRGRPPHSESSDPDGGTLDVDAGASRQEHEPSGQADRTAAVAPSDAVPTAAASNAAEPSGDGPLDMDSIFSSRR